MILNHLKMRMLIILALQFSLLKIVQKMHSILILMVGIFIIWHELHMLSTFVICRNSTLRSI